MTSTLTDDALLKDEYQGICRVCGKQGTFVRAHRSLREGYACPACRASLRYRGQAEALIELFSGGEVKSLAELVESPALQSLRIYEPGVSGPFRKYLSRLPGYVNSFFWEDVAPGTSRDGVTCQNLERLTYGEKTFDLVISSDIMEHVRHPWVAFSEVHWVLKPGAPHVFSIPVQKPMRSRTVERVDTSGTEDVHLLEPRYHGDGAGGQSLVYVDYGWDLVERLAEMGFAVMVLSPMDENDEARKLVTFISRRQTGLAT